jgi:hypothetical protein
MRVKEEFTEAQRRFGLLSFYDKFEHIVILILTVLIAVFIVFAIWNLALKIFLSHRLIAAPKVSAFSFWSDANAARPSRERLMPKEARLVLSFADCGSALLWTQLSSNIMCPISAALSLSSCRL